MSTWRHVASKSGRRRRRRLGRRRCFRCRRLCCAVSTAWFIVLMKLRVNNLVAGWRSPTPLFFSLSTSHSVSLSLFLKPRCALSLWSFQRLDLRLNITIFHEPLQPRKSRRETERVGERWLGKCQTFVIWGISLWLCKDYKLAQSLAWAQ